MKLWRIVYVLTLLYALYSISPFIAVAQECPNAFPPQIITFSEYPVGTSITTQYQTLGVVFSGSGIPFISSDGSNPTSPVLSGSPIFQGSITVTFVNPLNTGEPASAANVSFDAGYFNSVNSTTVTYLILVAILLLLFQIVAWGFNALPHKELFMDSQLG